MNNQSFGDYSMPFIEANRDNEFIMPICPSCGCEMKFSPIETSYGLLAKGLKFVCPLCGHEE